MKDLNVTSFAFYKVIYFLVENNRLSWKNDGGVKVYSEVTREFRVELGLYRHAGNRDVVDFRCIYSYVSVDHKDIEKSMMIRFRQYNALYKLMSCRELYDLALKSSKEPQDKIAPSGSQILTEFQNILKLKDLSESNDLKPFDYVLLEKVLALAID